MTTTTEAQARNPLTAEMTVADMAQAIKDETSPLYLSPDDRDRVLHYLLGYADYDFGNSPAVRHALGGAITHVLTDRTGGTR